MEKNYDKEQDLEGRARDALGFIPVMGIDLVNRIYSGAIQYGLEYRLFTQEQVDANQIQFREYDAKRALGFIPKSGIDIVSETSGDSIQYGLECRLFTQELVDAAQRQYEKKSDESRIKVNFLGKGMTKENYKIVKEKPYKPIEGKRK